MHCACAGDNLTLQLDQFSSMSKSNVVIQPFMKAVNDPRFDLEKYNAWARLLEDPCAWFGQFV
eukprot:4314403-Pleurochrysis_carterae.AAC.1